MHFLLFRAYNYVNGAHHTSALRGDHLDRGSFGFMLLYHDDGMGKLPWQPPRNFHPLLRSLQLSFLHFAFPLCEWPILPLLFFSSGADVTGGLNNPMSFIISKLTIIFLPLLALLLSRNVRAQATFVPPAIPLAVRSPYLSCWLQNSNPATLFGQTWPTTFNHSQVCHP
jgi:hypothetical protein